MLVKAGESALKKVSLDHYLFRELYSHSHSPKENTNTNTEQNKWPTPTYDENGKSHIDLSEEENVMMKKGCGI